MTHPILVERWPITPYEPALRWQHATAEAVRNGAPEALALLQHPPTYTHGRQIHPEHLLVDQPTLKARGAEVIHTDRGGDVTFHGPGQLVGYPILDLRRHDLTPVDYVRALEATLIRTLARFDIAAARTPGRPGVWVNDAKIAAIGIRVQRGITTHGFALNVDPDLTWFEAIIPCGLPNTTVTSMQALGHPATLAVVTDTLTAEFTAIFDLALVDEVRQRS